MRDGRLLFSVRGAIVFAKILVQSEQSVCCPNVNSHSDANTKAAEKVDQNHFMQCTRREKLNGWVDTPWMVGPQQCNTMR
uniref:Secreted protein n=1 Tax=Romanomermis culicivorax TaxID=13658 RepID=A0A915I6U7_ROMCU